MKEETLRLAAMAIYRQAKKRFPNCPRPPRSVWPQALPQYETWLDKILALYDNVSPDDLTKWELRADERWINAVINAESTIQQEKNKRKYCEVDWDEAYSVAHDTEEEPVDVVYFDVAEGPDGWYLSMDLDCNSGGFTETLGDDDGPYNGKEAAILAGFDGALDWFGTNWPEDAMPSEDAIDSRLHHLAWWLPAGKEYYQNHGIALNAN